MWQDEGACSKPDPVTGKPIDPETFFPTSSSHAAAEDARAVCFRCPVIVECLEHALANPRLRGVWGATTERQRRKAQGISAHQAKMLSWR